MIREIFVPLLGSTGDEAALDAALAIATAQEAHVTAMVTVQYPMPLVTDYGYVPLELDQRLLADARAEAATRAERARARLGPEAVACGVRGTEAVTLWCAETAAMHALHCDMSVIGRPGMGELAGSPRFDLTFRSLLLRSGRPVVVVPSQVALPIPAVRVVLAWKPTPQAARALHDALPLLAGAAEIDVLVVEPKVVDGGYGEQPGADIGRLLARHGVRVNVVQQPRAGLTTGECILRHVREIDAGLLIMGGYGHRHWRELVLGGATRTVVEGAPCAVLLSH
jgi:nucleotide-binding universal stress UspA family protein